eukprot:TRINITY_DN21184_c0_g1_i1.p1 TRINITY_DN21184_c0_g1~~TRINITY_DN21184_c0_g1_i1.p1  ORF type:complete len:191 (+),score=33.26 TRINITY_DN21184_c0_g1_i1:43-615(+)
MRNEQKTTDTQPPQTQMESPADVIALKERFKTVDVSKISQLDCAEIIATLRYWIEAFQYVNTFLPFPKALEFAKRTPEILSALQPDQIFWKCMLYAETIATHHLISYDSPEGLCNAAEGLLQTASLWTLKESQKTATPLWEICHIAWAEMRFIRAHTTNWMDMLHKIRILIIRLEYYLPCLLYTSDAADE